MTTITRFTKEQLRERAREKVKSLEFAVTQNAFADSRAELEEELELARIALASLTAEPVLYAAEETLAYANMGEIHLTCLSEPMGDAVIPLYTAPPAPVVDADPVVFTDERNLHHIARGRETSLIWGKQNQEVGDIPLYRHAQPVPVDKEFIPKNLDKALGVVGVALPESKEEFNFQIERWIQRLIDRVIRYADEFKEQPVPVLPDDISGIIERFQYQADHLSEWHHIDEHSCKVNRRDLMTALEFMDSCRAAMLNGGKS